jgi:hypothetical protein
MIEERALDLNHRASEQQHYTAPMTLESCYYLAGIVSSGVGLAGLVGLVLYTRETHKIRKATQQQLESATAPCVFVVGDPGKKGLDGPLSMRNFGVGPALNIRWRYRKEQNRPGREFPALGPGEVMGVSFVLRDVINGGMAIECEFESLSGVRYLTTSEVEEATQTFDFHHRFRRL